MAAIPLARAVKAHLRATETLLRLLDQTAKVPIGRNRYCTMLQLSICDCVASICDCDAVPTLRCAHDWMDDHIKRRNVPTECLKA